MSAPTAAGPTPRYRCTLLRAGEFRLDAGSMFGLIPRAVWSRSVPVDEKNRMTLQHNCLLLERVGSGAGPRLVLLEAGTGDKLDDKSREIFALERRSIVDALREAGHEPGEVEAVVVSHLHFDHAGGLTRLCKPGEAPDWTGPASSFAAARPDHGVKRTFPRAKVIVQRREWDDARANRSVMTRTYFADHLGPIEGAVTLVDSPLPFAAGAVVERDGKPGLPQAARETEVLPGVFVFLAPGHTWGQQATRFVREDGRSVVFVPDVMPTAWHAGAAYSLGYDVEPYTSMVSRTWLLETAAAEGWVLMLDHEPGWPFFTVKRGKSWWELVRDGEAG